MEKQWKPIVLEGADWLDGRFIVSEYGEVEQVHSQGNIPLIAQVLKTNQLVVSLRVYSNKVNATKKITVSHLVATMFLNVPKGRRVHKVAFIDETIVPELRNHYTNLIPSFSPINKEVIKVAKVIQPELPLEIVPKKRIRLMRKSDISVAYYEFRKDGIYSVRNNKLIEYIKIKDKDLVAIYEKYRHKLNSREYYSFSNLTEEEIEDIISMMPNKRWNPITRR